LELLRARLLVRIGELLHNRSCERVFNCQIWLPVKTGHAGSGLHPVKDLDTVRSFLSGQGPSALFDLPWIPLYLFLLFVFHPYLGLVALVGGLLLVALTLLTEVLTRASIEAAAGAATERERLADVTRRNAEAVHALGMGNSMALRWRVADDEVLRHSRGASDVALGFSSVSRTLRLMLQSMVLAVGALLVIQQEASGGLILASAILSGRALAPIDTAIAHWRGFVSARESWRRLSHILAAFPEIAAPLRLPAPGAQLSVQNLSVLSPGSSALILDGITFSLQAGDALGVIGPSASGKSSLGRALTGVWPAAGGTVQLDGAALGQWSAEGLGRHIGYLPQSIELFPGTIAENVARFDPGADPDNIIKAARAADVHELILSLPHGYETRVGTDARALSAGQQQRIALARALYGDPFLVVLDEPNSSLDLPGEAGLSKAIQEIRRRNGIAVVISHRPSVLHAVNLVLQLSGGRLQRFGPKNDTIQPSQRLTASVQRIGGTA
jgi:ATP-binding cassette subfamily C protein